MENDSTWPLVITFDDGHNSPRRFLCKGPSDVLKVCERYSLNSEEAYDALCPGSADYVGEHDEDGDRLFVDSWDPSPVDW